VTAQITPVIEYAWERQGVWSKTADQLKASAQSRWRLRMILTVAAAALALAGAQLKPVSTLASWVLAAVAAVALAGVGLLRVQQDAEETRRWTRARSVSEAMKAEVYTFLAQSGDGQSASPEATLEAEIQRLESAAGDLLPFTGGVSAQARALPSVHDTETYLDVRVRRSQLESFYEPKAARLRKQLRWAKTTEVTLTLMAAALAAFATVSPNVGAWAAVVTTAVGAVTAYVASERYEFLWMEYSRTAGELRRLCSRRTAADGRRLSGVDLVNECEQVISVQNQTWLAKWGEKKSSGAK
jgi:phosphate/sulfate permease